MTTCAVCELHAESTFKVEGMDCREEVALIERAVLIIEEGAPDYIEQQVAAILRKRDVQTRIYGKDVLPMAGEYTAEVVTDGLLKFFAQTANDIDLSAPRERLDYFGNRTLYFSLNEPHRTLEILARSLVEVSLRPDVDRAASPAWEDVREALRTPRRRDILDACQFVFDSPQAGVAQSVVEYARPSFRARRPLLEAVWDLVNRMHRDFAYDSQATDVSTPVTEVMAKRRGVCQDFAHVAIAALRGLGLSARYVSGYLLTRPPPGRPRLVGADASHAWLSVFVPDAGWYDFDPTNNLQPADEHITVAWGRDFSDVTPVRGVILGGGRHVVRVSVDVTPVR